MSFDPYEFDRGYPQSWGESLGEYTAKTFLWMVAGLLVTFGVGVLGWSTGLAWAAYQTIPGFHLLLLVATLVMSFTMVGRIERMQVGTAVALFLSMATLFGFTVSLYLYVFQLSSVLLVFLATAVYFVILAAYGRLTRTDLTGLRPILTSGLIFLVAFYLLSWLIPGLHSFDRIVCMIGIASFLGYTAYDTRRIRDYYNYYSGYPEMLAKASIFSALQLYLDFLNLFVYLLRYMGSKRR